MAAISLTYLGENVEFVDKSVVPALQSTRQTDQTLKVLYR